MVSSSRSRFVFILLVNVVNGLYSFSEAVFTLDSDFGISRGRLGFSRKGVMGSIMTERRSLKYPEKTKSTASSTHRNFQWSSSE